MFQGAGAAAVPTLGVAVLSARYDGEVRGLALGRLAGMAAAVSCLGPLLGGAVEHAFGWRAVMALPILGVLVLPFLWRALAGEGSGARLDLLGRVLVAATARRSRPAGPVARPPGDRRRGRRAPARCSAPPRSPCGCGTGRTASCRSRWSATRTVVRSALAAAAVPAAWFALLIAVPAVLVGEGWAAWQVGLLLVPSAVVALFVPRYAGPLLTRIGPAAALAIAGRRGLRRPAARGARHGAALAGAAGVHGHAWSPSPSGSASPR